MATYESAIEWLNDNDPFFVTPILSLGKPVYDSSISTMCVRKSVDSSFGDFEFAINPGYIDAYSDEEIAGSLIHEVIHIFLGHLQEAISGDFDDAQSLIIAHEVICNDRLTEGGFILPDIGALFGPEIIGEDASPYTTEEVYEKIMNENKDEETIENAENSSVSSDKSSSENGSSDSSPSTNGNNKSSGRSSKNDGENKVSEESNDKNNSDDNSSVDGSENEENGEEKTDSDTDKNSNENDENPSETNGQQESSTDNLEGNNEGKPICHIDVDSLTQEVIDKIFNNVTNAVDESVKQNMAPVNDEISDMFGISESSVSKSEMAGTSYTESEVQAAERLGIKVAWLKLLKRVNPEILQKKGKVASKTRPTWATPRRKLAHMSDKVMLPNYEKTGDKEPKQNRGNNKPYIVLALDFSGSIPTAWQKVLAELAQSIPEELIDVDCCTFSTKYVPFDHKAKRNSVASGGTNFSAVESFVRSVQNKHGGKYPSSVIVFTDGQAGFYSNLKPTSEQLKENWTWVLLNSSDRLYVQTDKETITYAKEFVDKLPQNRYSWY